MIHITEVFSFERVSSAEHANRTNQPTAAWAGFAKEIARKRDQIAERYGVELDRVEPVVLHAAQAEECVHGLFYFRWSPDPSTKIA